jgi:hypothetical protein
MSARTPFEVRRHHSKLSEKETNAAIGILADLIVTYIEKRSECSSRGSGAVPARTSEERR